MGRWGEGGRSAGGRGGAGAARASFANVVGSLIVNEADSALHETISGGSQLRISLSFVRKGGTRPPTPSPMTAALLLLPARRRASQGAAELEERWMLGGTGPPPSRKRATITPW